MTRYDEAAVQLDRHLDALLRGASPPDDLDPALAATLRHLCALAERPAPDPAFVRRLEADLMSPAGGVRLVTLDPLPTRPPGIAGVEPDAPTCPRSPIRPRRWWRTATELAAAVLLLLTLVGGSFVGGRLLRTLSDPGPMPVAGPGLATPTIGVAPVRLRIPGIGVDAQVRGVATDGGEGVRRFAEAFPDADDWSSVSWYEETSRLGTGGNTVVVGLLSQWSVGPAVFWQLSQLQPGDRIEVVGEDGTVYDYEVDWVRDYVAADLTPDAIAGIVGPTGHESLTLVTEGGQFDSNAGEYLGRTVVRAHRIAGPATPRAVADRGARGS